jgi:hypothetical protein
MADARLDPETYATIVARISAGADRATVLAEHGFDEETFEAAEGALDDALSIELESASEDNAPPASVIAFDRAFRSASLATGDPASFLTIERYAEAVAILESGDRIEHRLAQAGLTLSQVFRATAHYAPRLAREPDLAASFQRHKKRDRGNEGMDR